MFNLHYALRGAADLAERLSGPPEESAWQKWFLGALVPGAVVGAVIASIVDPAAGARFHAGIAFVVCLALLAHVHYFWYQSPRLQPYAEMGKTILTVPLLLLIAYGCFLFFVRLI